MHPVAPKPNITFSCGAVHRGALYEICTWRVKHLSLSYRIPASTQYVWLISQDSRFDAVSWALYLILPSPSFPVFFFHHFLLFSSFLLTLSFLSFFMLSFRMSLWPCDALYPQNWIPTSPTSDDRWVSIVLSRTQATELLFLLSICLLFALPFATFAFFSSFPYSLSIAYFPFLLQNALH
jgi:hypothetical protein